MSTALLLYDQGPGTPCSPPVPGAPVTTTTTTVSTPAPTPFDGESIIVSVGGVVLLLALVATLIVRRLKQPRIGWRRVVLVVLSLAFAAFAAAWIWQLKTTYAGGGCALYFDATPFSEDDAFTFAPLLSLLVCAIALGWIVTTLFSAFSRRTAKA